MQLADVERDRGRDGESQRYSTCASAMSRLRFQGAEPCNASSKEHLGHEADRETPHEAVLAPEVDHAGRDPAPSGPGRGAYRPPVQVRGSLADRRGNPAAGTPAGPSLSTPAAPDASGHARERSFGRVRRPMLDDQRRPPQWSCRTRSVTLVHLGARRWCPPGCSAMRSSVASAARRYPRAIRSTRERTARCSARARGGISSHRASTCWNSGSWTGRDSSSCCPSTSATSHCGTRSRTCW